MSILARATEKSQYDWRPVPEGLWRWRLGKPELKMDEKYGKYRVIISLHLPKDEQDRALALLGPTELGQQQSFRATYRPNLSLGHFNKKGQFETTMLVDFLCAAMGVENGKRLRKWIEQGGGPPRPADPDDADAEISLIDSWLGWWEDLEVYGTISHSESNGQTWANFGGPMPVGSLPGNPEAEYQSLCRGKLRAAIAEAQGQAYEPHEPDTATQVREEVAKARTAVANDDLPF